MLNTYMAITYTEEYLREEASKYKTRTEFRHNNQYAAKAALNREIFISDLQCEK